MSTRNPPLLEPCLSLPPETSLIVLTSVLGASTNWLLLRYLHTFLNTKSGPNATPSQDPAAEPGTGVSVVLLSFLRDYPFWRDGAARLGVDLDAAGRKGRFVYVDGLTGLFLPGSGYEDKAPAWTVRLTSPRIEDVSRAVQSVMDEIAARGGSVVLLMDQLDLLLAAAEGEATGLRLGEMMLDLREKTHATVITLSADDPLVVSQATTLEKEHASLVLSAAHEAELVLSLRLLDTGTAKDVSGVLRITRGGGESSRSVEEKEYLYHVLGDGGVQVFERGQ